MESASVTFDQAAEQYDLQLQQGLDLSGENPDYFVQGRVDFVARELTKLKLPAHSILDFGSGVGNAALALRDSFSAEEVIGLDCSEESIHKARQRYPEKPFEWCSEARPNFVRRFDLAYTSGVFHHIAPGERQAHLEDIYGWLKPGGIFAFFENNPWNPGTRWVMSRIPFDRDAICLSMIESKNRLRSAGFRILQSKSLFYFPRMLSPLRPLEGILQHIPLGAQYVVLATRD